MSDQIKKIEDLGINVKDKPHGAKAIGFGLIVIMIFFVGMGSWAYFAPLESAAISEGKIIVAGYRRTIEHLEGGIIQAIHVQNGAKVKKGQVLASLDDIQPKTMLQMQRNEVNELLAIEARLIAERDHSNSVNFPKRLREQSNNLKVHDILQGQASIFKSNQDDLKGNVDILNQRIVQLKQEISGLEIQMKATATQLRLIKKEIKSVKYLAEKRLIEESRLLTLQREEAKLEGYSGETISRIALTEQKIGETKLQITAAKSKRRTEVLTELRKAQQKLTQVSAKEKVAADTLKHTQIRAPLDGFVVNSRLHTIGGVVQPGGAIMDVVPTQEALVIESRVSPLDIDVVQKGLEAKVTLSSFKQRTTPTLLGTVTRISADALVDKKTGEHYYNARIIILPNEIKKLGGKSLQPGMPVQVMIITNTMSTFDYITSPIKASFDRAFRED